VSNATNCPAGKFGRVVFENTRSIGGWHVPTLDRLTAMMIDTLHLR
jgi:hypothetical protein